MTSKRLFFKSVDLGDDVALKLFLMPRDATAKPSPVLWRETTLGASGYYGLDLTWDPQMVFLKPQGVLCGHTASAATWVPIEIGQETTLSEKPTCLTDGGPPTYAFTKPVPREGLLSAVKAVNDTGHPVFLSLGMIDKGTVYEVIRSYGTWKVGEGSCVQTGLPEPVLRAYVLLKHQEGGCVSGSIGTSEPVLEVNMLSLGPETAINILKDKLIGKFSATISATALPLPVLPTPPTSATPESQVPPKESVKEQPTTEEDDAPTPPSSADGKSVSKPAARMPVEKVGQETTTSQPEFTIIGLAETAEHQSPGAVEPHKDGDHKQVTDGTNQAVSISDTSGPSKGAAASNGVPGGPNLAL